MNGRDSGVRSLKLALAMLTLVPGGMGGSETYARALTRELASLPELAVTAFVPEGAEGFSEGVRESVVRSVSGGASNRARVGMVARSGLHARSIREAMAEAEVVHYPFTVQAPRAARRQAIVQSLHDVQHLDLPELFSRPELLYRRHFYEGGARRADIVVTISEFAKRRMVELLGLPSEKIQVAHLGVDTTSFVPNFGERENFVLYPARGWAHKNHPRLIEAMRIVRKSIPDIRLVLTGGGLDVLGELPDWVDRQGLVSTSELHELYRSAAVLAFPSLYEGFGLPPLEAMASGCPAAVADAGSIPEVCGGAAVLFDPLDPDAIAQGICAAITRSKELSIAGVAQAKRFTWTGCRDSHLAAYQHARAVH